MSPTSSSLIFLTHSVLQSDYQIITRNPWLKEEQHSNERSRCHKTRRRWGLLKVQGVLSIGSWGTRCTQLPNRSSVSEIGRGLRVHSGGSLHHTRDSVAEADTQFRQSVQLAFKGVLVFSTYHQPPLPPGQQTLYRKLNSISK
jgi:hypothetical protein